MLNVALHLPVSPQSLMLSVLIWRGVSLYILIIVWLQLELPQLVSSRQGAVPGSITSSHSCISADATGIINIIIIGSVHVFILHFVIFLQFLSLFLCFCLSCFACCTLLFLLGILILFLVVRMLLLLRLLQFCYLRRLGVLLLRRCSRFRHKCNCIALSRSILVALCPSLVCTLRRLCTLLSPCFG